LENTNILWKISGFAETGLRYEACGVWQAACGAPGISYNFLTMHQVTSSQEPATGTIFIAANREPRVASLYY
jgi:hypothetical protein